MKIELAYSDIKNLLLSLKATYTYGDGLSDDERNDLIELAFRLSGSLTDAFYEDFGAYPAKSASKLFKKLPKSKDTDE